MYVLLASTTVSFAPGSTLLRSSSALQSSPVRTVVSDSRLDEFGHKKAASPGFSTLSPIFLLMVHSSTNRTQNSGRYASSESSIPNHNPRAKFVCGLSHYYNLLGFGSAGRVTVTMQLFGEPSLPHL